MAGPSQPSSFKPMDLMEGYSPKEVFGHLCTVEGVLNAAFGKEAEIKVIALSFLMGQYLRESRVTTEQAFGMVLSSMDG